jgi:hypothetical protein
MISKILLFFTISGTQPHKKLLPPQSKEKFEAEKLERERYRVLRL